MEATGRVNERIIELLKQKDKKARFGGLFCPLSSTLILRLLNKKTKVYEVLV